MLQVNPDENQGADSDEVFIEPIEIPRLLTQITDLMANRAYGRSLKAHGEAAA